MRRKHQLVYNYSATDAGMYGDCTDHLPIEGKESIAQVEACLPYLSEKKSCIDLVAGVGTITGHLLTIFDQVDVEDINEKYLDVLVARHPKIRASYQTPI